LISSQESRVSEPTKGKWKDQAKIDRRTLLHTHVASESLSSQSNSSDDKKKQAKMMSDPFDVKLHQRIDETRNREIRRGWSCGMLAKFGQNVFLLPHGCGAGGMFVLKGYCFFEVPFLDNFLGRP